MQEKSATPNVALVGDREFEQDWCRGRTGGEERDRGGSVGWPYSCV